MCESSAKTVFLVGLVVFIVLLAFATFPDAGDRRLIVVFFRLHNPVGYESSPQMLRNQSDSLKPIDNTTDFDYGLPTDEGRMVSLLVVSNRNADDGRNNSAVVDEWETFASDNLSNHSPTSAPIKNEGVIFSKSAEGSVVWLNLSSTREVSFDRAQAVSYQKADIRSNLTDN